MVGTSRLAILPIALLGLLTSMPLLAAKARLSADEIFEYETVQLELSGARDATPDLTPLEEHFEILNRSSHSSMQIVNGRIEVSENTLKLTIRPRGTGRLVIPPITFGDEQTNALALNVKPLDANAHRSIDALAFYEIEVSNQHPYQGEAVFLTRRLFYAPAVQVYGSLPGLPEVPGATVQPLEEPKSTHSLRNGQRYNVFVSEFVLFADQSGELSIPSVEVMARMQLSGSAQGRTLGVPIRSRAITLSVRPPPDIYPAGKAWLPAHDVSIESEATSQVLHVGVPLSFNVTVSVDGALASQVAPLEIAFPASIKRYRESPRLEDKLTSGHVSGIRTERYSLVPTLPGILTLPELRLVWWDTQHQRLREATLAAREIEVLPNPEMRAESRQSPAVDELAVSPQPTLGDAQLASGWAFDWLDMLLGVLCVIFGIGWLLSARPDWYRSSFFAGAQAKEASAEESAFERVKGARTQTELLSALRAWMPFMSRQDDAYLDLESLVQRTEAGLYASDTNRPAQSPSMRELSQAATSLRKVYLSHAQRKRNVSLPGLYSPDALSHERLVMPAGARARG